MISKEDLQYEIELTGNYVELIEEGNYSYEHVILNESSYKRIQMLPLKEQEKLFKSFDADFISVKRNGKISFIHLTDVMFLPNIKKHGLKADTEWIHDLGVGIYGFKLEADERHMNLFWNNNRSGGKMFKIKGTFNGEYLECVFDNSGTNTNHVGYLVMKTTIIEPQNLIFQ
jgi:hypothetical protein